MATTRIIPLHAGKGRSVGAAISRIIDYVKNPEKTGNGKYITSFECDSRVADAEFLFSKRRYQDITGRVQENDVIAYQVRQSFKPGEVTPEEANRIGYEFAMRFLKGNNAFIVCTHVDRQHIHNHIIWNSTTLACDRKFRNFWGSTKAVRLLSDTICVEHGLSIVENPKRHGKNYGDWLGEKESLPHREQIRLVLDDVLERKPADFSALLTLLKDSGVEVKRRGRTISLRCKGRPSYVRFSSLGNGYTEAELQAVLAGETQHTQRKKPSQKSHPQIDLISRLDEKIQSTGGGYRAWASKQRAKQVTQTYSYLQEHKLMDYAELERKTADATARYHTLSKQNKAAELRMTEIAVLKKHIINYAKTREVFAAYKASGYSKKYLAEHESDILLHRTAKKAFNDMGIVKLPTVKSLQEEYAHLLAEKKSAYAELRYARDEMRELLIVKSNVDRMLGIEVEKAEQEKEQAQR